MHCTIQVNSLHYHPAWASLARDYLSIMSSSVSSKCRFSQGGLTITKHRNRLKSDVVEALQCVKCAIWHDLLFKEPAPSSIVEAEFADDHWQGDQANEDGNEKGWDVEFVSDEEDGDNSSDDMEMVDVDTG